MRQIFATIRRIHKRTFRASAGWCLRIDGCAPGLRGFMGYVTARLLQGLIVLLGVSLLSFGLLEVAPGDYFQEMRLNPQISPDTIARLRQHYDMDASLPARYSKWLASVVRGDLGFSFSYDSP